MKKFIYAILMIAIVVMLQAKEPAHLKLTGLPPFLNAALVKDCRISKGIAEITAVLDTNEIKFMIAPWTFGGFLKNKIAGSELNSKTFYSPAGPGRALEFLRDGNVFLGIKSGIIEGTEVLPGVTIGIGDKVKKINGGGKRYWMKTVLNGSDGKKYTVKPGETLTIMSEGRKWRFFLVGASAPESLFSGTNISGAVKGIEREEPGFIADFVVYRAD